MHKFNRIRQAAPMSPHGRTHCRHLANTIEPPVSAAMRLTGMSNYFDHLLSVLLHCHTCCILCDACCETYQTMEKVQTMSHTVCDCLKTTLDG